MKELVSFAAEYGQVQRQMLEEFSIPYGLLDIDGKCGGYNLQWAWSSGYVAGMNAGR